MSQQVLCIEYVAPSELRLDPKNPRRHSEKQIRQIANSIRTFGFVAPLLVDNDRQVIAGHGRLLASRSIGVTRIPVIRLEYLSAHQKRALMLADNKLAQNAEWDEHILGEQLKILAEAEIDFSLDVTGFEVAEIDLILENLAPDIDGNSDPADILPEPSIAVSQYGDVWKLNKHRVLCGNALSHMDYKLLMGNEKAAVMFTDPPYNVRIGGNVSGHGKIQHREFLMASGEMGKFEFTSFLSDFLSLAALHSTNGSLHYIFMDWRHLEQLLTAGRTVFHSFDNLCVWVKSNSGLGSFYKSQHELICIFVRGTASHRNNVQLGRYGRNRTNVWHYPSVNALGHSGEGNLLALHPTVKPVALVADAILDSSKRGDIILDPFVGSGTTVVAAERVGRICYAMELDPTYIDTAIRRWQQFTGLPAIHEGTGQTFAEREQEVRHANS